MKQPQAMGRGAYLYQPQLQQAHGDGDPRGSCRIREKQRALQQPDPTAREWRRAAEVSVWGMTKHHRALPLGMAWRAAKIPAHQEKAAPSGSLRWEDEELGTM